MSPAPPNAPSTSQPSAAADDCAPRTSLTIYESAARLNGPTARLAARLTDIGCHIRVASFALTKMMIFDRTVAIVPASADLNAAVFLEDPATITFMVEVFERFWQLSEGVNWSALAAGSSGSPVHEQVGRLLAQGLTQRSTAGRLASASARWPATSPGCANCTTPRPCSSSAGR
ncbi:hypothetical protein ACIG5E_04080 [Kitasatospora sp. NPDC053057]|uniref:hypothetical protein n=1 Tax=Kitasatospora sp. NPDC053057 TaxID=3364062 RepID=UPI0037CB7224